MAAGPDPSTVLTTDNFWILVCTALVAAGVILEFVDLLLFNKEISRIQRRLLFIASVMVVAGCGGEFWFDKQAAQAEAQIQRASDEKVAGLSAAEAVDNKIAQGAAKNAADLGVKVATLPTFVAKKEGEISALAARMEQSSAALDKARTDAQASETKAEAALATMTAANAPRGLTDDQKAGFVRRLSKYRGVTVGVYVSGESSLDSAPLADTIAELLTRSGWNPSVYQLLGPAGVKGIEIAWRGDASARAKWGADALRTELRLDNVAAALDAPPKGKPVEVLGAMVGNGTPQTENPDVWVVVGSKP